MSQNPLFATENIPEPLLDSVPFSSSTDTSPAASAVSRRTLLGLGALVGAALALPALPARADFVYSDIRALRFLEEIAGLEADFFAKAAMSAPAAGLSEREMNTFNLIARQDSELLRWFAAARGRYGISAFDKFYSLNQSASRPLAEYRFGNATSGTRTALFSRAIDVKTTAVGAFHGAVGETNDPKLVQAFASLAGVQGRHLAMLQELDGQSPFTPFEAAISLREAADKLSTYGFKAEALG